MLRTVITTNSNYLTLLGLNVEEQKSEALNSKVAGMFLRYHQGKSVWKEFELALCESVQSIRKATQLFFVCQVPNSFLTKFVAKLREAAYRNEVWHAFKNFFDSGKGKRLLKPFNKKLPNEMKNLWAKIVSF